MEPKDSSRERQEKEEKSLDTLPPPGALAMDLSLRWLRCVCFPWILSNILAEG